MNTSRCLAAFVVSAILVASRPVHADLRVWERGADAPPAASTPVDEGVGDAADTASEPTEPAPPAEADSVTDTPLPDAPAEAIEGTPPPPPVVEVAPIPAPPAPHEPHRYLDLTGFIQPGYVHRFTDAYAGVTSSGFWLQRARFGFRAQVTEWLLIRTELELAPVPALQDAYVDIAPHPAIQFRVGQFLVPFLLAFQFNELNLGFLDRPIYTPLSPDRPVIRYLSPRDVGGMVFGRVGNTEPGARSPVFDYAFGLFLGRGANQFLNEDRAFLFALRAQLHLLGRPEGADAESSRGCSSTRTSRTKTRRASSPTSSGPTACLRSRTSCFRTTTRTASRPAR